MGLSCQPQVFEVRKAMKEQSSSGSSMNRIVGNAVNLCSTYYILVGFFGYILFYNKDLGGTFSTHFFDSTPLQIWTLFRQHPHFLFSNGANGKYQDCLWRLRRCQFSISGISMQNSYSFPMFQKSWIQYTFGPELRQLYPTQSLQCHYLSHCTDHTDHWHNDSWHRICLGAGGFDHWKCCLHIVAFRNFRKTQPAEYDGTIGCSSHFFRWPFSYGGRNICQSTHGW